MPESYYFGAWGGYGHQLWTPCGMMALSCASPWSVDELDQRLAGDPALEDPRRRGYWPSDAQPEGRVRLHHRDGWTAIAFWDRSGDERGGSNSVFVARGVFCAREMVAMFQEAFPAVWARITARFALRLPPEPARIDDPPGANTGLRFAEPRVRIAETATVDLSDLAEPEEETAAERRRAVAVGAAQ